MKGMLDVKRCQNTRIPYETCDCLDCRPWIWTYSGLLDESKTIYDIVTKFEEAWAYFKALNDGGFTMRGSFSDGFIQLIPPKKPGYYWMRCQDCGSFFEAPIDSTMYSCNLCVSDMGAESMSY